MSLMKHSKGIWPQLFVHADKNQREAGCGSQENLSFHSLLISAITGNGASFYFTLLIRFQILYKITVYWIITWLNYNDREIKQ